MDQLVPYLWFAAGLLVITAITVGINLWNGTRIGWFPLWAIARAVVQLTVIALLLRGILSVPWTVIAFVALMLTTASLTSAQRLNQLWRGRRTAVVGVLSGAVVAVSLVFALRLVEWQVRYLIAVAGIIIGNAMSAATLAGRNFLRGSQARFGEIEAWLSLGAPPPIAHLAIAQEATRESLLPTLDQAKSTGLVTLPGAFVGALFGGASPADAALFQLAILAGIALAASTTAVVVTRLVSRSPVIGPVTPV